MDESQELTDAEIRELRAKLEALRLELGEALSKRSSHAKPVDRRSNRLSRVDAMQRQAMAQANLRSAARRLEQVEAALLAIDNESFGDCRLCDEPIGFKRLSARPEAPFCLECQRSRAER